MPRLPVLCRASVAGALPRFLLLVLLASVLAGCAQSIVHLVYSAPKETITPRAGAPTVCVVAFEDRRGKDEIGQRRDGGLFLAHADVTGWVSRAMADELARTGLTVTYTSDIGQAKASNPDYIVTGVIDEIWLTESSLTRYASSMRVTISLLRGNGSYITKNNYSSTFSKTVIPMSDVPQSMLSEGLIDLLRPAARNIERLAQ